jgi:predicted  nucleic acid-binding Zn-ribbon protein
VTEQGPEEERRVAELMRINRELANEVRDLRKGRTAEPRPSQLPAARHVAKLRGERDSLAEQLDATRAELHEVREERDRLAHRASALEREVVRLRSGIAGLLKRARARLLRS